MATAHTEALFAAAAASVKHARGWARVWLVEQKVPEDVRDSVVLCRSEILTNAVRHQGSGEIVAARLVRFDDAAAVSVEDSGDVFLEHAVPVAEFAEGGRGLAVVRAVSAQWGVQPRAGGKVVWCEVARPHEPSPTDLINSRNAK
ncbi:ATP-binding protein [Uniformispora flossi]|uniref:ATP-binding protein n=1 Tax=Uniformispora flossi TaxID=3390723 RepID=UPI003C30BE50